ncbi:MAG: hypothetical protein R6X02_13285 [Enhygromyxa sp.]
MSLWYKHERVDSIVDLIELEPEAPQFDVAPSGRPQDSMLTVTIAAGLIRIELHEPERLELNTRLEVERRLPPIVLAVRHGAWVEPIRLLGGARVDGPRAPLWVRRSGTPTDLVVAIGAGSPTSFPLARDTCELSWSLGSRPRSLCFGVASDQLTLRPTRHD